MYWFIDAVQCPIGCLLSHLVNNTVVVVVLMFIDHNCRNISATEMICSSLEPHVPGGHFYSKNYYNSVTFVLCLE